MYNESLPSSEDLVPDWFTGVLRNSGHLGADAKVTDVSLTPLGSAESMMSNLWKAGLSYADEADSGPATVVVKMASPAEAERFVATMFKFYEREILFYHEYAERTTVRRPACFLAEIHPTEPDFVLILEDIGGRRAVDQVVGLEFDDTRSAIDALVELQVPFWGTDLDEAAETCMRYDSEGLHLLLPDKFNDDWAKTKAAYGDRMAPELIDLGDRFSTILSDVLRAMNGPGDTLCHGDCRSDNFLFDDDGVMVFDFQLMSVAQGVTDIAYLLSQSVQTQVMADHGEELIAYYLDRLGSRGINLTREDVAPAYDAALVFFVQIPVSMLCSESMPERSKELGLVMLDRITAELRRTGAHNRFV